MNNALKIVNAMYSQDAFSQWLGIEIIEVSKGNCQLKMLVKKEMLNGFKICHGGIAYSLADSALAFAANTHGNKSLSLETSISHLETVKEGDVLTAVTKEKFLSEKMAKYFISIMNQNGKKIAIFKGRVHRTSTIWFAKNE
jgi:acyl-CoA thioesterase